MNGLISVIVPVHNAERFLSDCLGSLTDQTYRKLEILVIDDGSTDGSAALCRRWSDEARQNYLEAARLAREGK